MDRLDPMRKQRDQLVNKMESSNKSLNEILADLHILKQTYTIRDPLYRFGLIIPLQTLAEKYCNKMEHKKAFKYFEEIFELVKDYNDFQAMLIIREMAKCCFKMNKKIDSCKQKAFDYFESMSFCKIFYETVWDKIISN